MLKTLCSSLLLLLLMSASPAQTQLRKASDYFPLQIGNVWQYDNTNEAEYLFYEVVSDSVLGDSVRVYKVKRSGLKGIDLKPFEGAPYYYHYNADSTVVYRDDFEFPKEPFTGFPMIDTRKDLGMPWEYFCGDYYCSFAVIDTGSANFHNRIRHWAEVYEVDRSLDTLRLVALAFRFVRGIGPVKHGRDTLVYARINGVAYGTTVGVTNEPRDPATVPRRMTLQSHPNPFSSQTTISVTSTERNPVEIRIIDTLGRTVRSLILQGSSEMLRFTWDGRDNVGRILSNGVYLLTAKSRNNFSTHKILYLR